MFESDIQLSTYVSKGRTVKDTCLKVACSSVNIFESGIQLRTYV